MPKRTALIATLPKSGTWYCHSFLWCYDQLLRNANAYWMGEFMPNLSKALREKRITNISHHSDTLGIDDLFVCHSICPGFTTSNDERMKAWKDLHFPLPSNWGETFIRKHKSWEALDPAVSPDSRIIYIFRNPLDHFVSYHRHILKHKDISQRMKRLPNGKLVPIGDLRDFIFDFGILGAFIKHYYSFKRMQELYPAQILMMPYERLITSPFDAFTQMLSFLGTPLNSELIADALAMSSKESLMAIEAKLGRSIAGDQMKGEKHIRNGGTGGWVDHFSNDDLERIESVFAAFDMTLGEFQTAGSTSGDKQSLGWLKYIESNRREMHQEDFFWQLRQKHQPHKKGGIHLLRNLRNIALRVKELASSPSPRMAD